MFFFPAASHVEKEGTFTNTQRLLQWREKAVEPSGDQRSELWFFYHLGRMIKDRLAGSTDPRDRSVQDLNWAYETSGGPGPDAEPSGESVLKAINDGPDAVAATPSSRPTARPRAAAGSTPACTRRASTSRPGESPADQQESGYLEWGWAWPMDRRVLYNRASADPDGKPWSERKKYVWWDEGKGRWVGRDVPDFEATKPPSYRPPEGASGPEALRGDDPFIMQADGKGWLFVPNGLQDGPMPTHYEPHESPFRNALYGQQGNPTRKVYGRDDNPSNPSPPEPHSDVFPYVLPPRG